MIASVWRDVVGYGGRYQVDIDGNVRRKWETRTPTLMHPYRHSIGRKNPSAREYVKLTGRDGKARAVAVISIVADAWHGGRPAGMVAYHINGDTGDHNANNIGFTTPAELGRKTGPMSRRKPVRKIDRSGETVAIYPSARAAAGSDYISYQAVCDRCNGQVKRPFELSGYSYEWDDDAEVSQ